MHACCLPASLQSCACVWEWLLVVCAHACAQVPWLILFTTLTLFPVHAPVYYLLVGTYVSGHGAWPAAHIC